MLTQDALAEAAQVGADVLAQGPVDGDVAADGRDQLAGDAAEGLVAEHLHRAVVDAERVVEGKLVVRETEGFAAGAGFAQLARDGDQLLE